MSNFDMSQGFPMPEWLICGMQLPEGYPTPEGHEQYRARIIASKSLYRADLRADFNYHDIYDGIFPVAHTLTGASYTLTTVMNNLIIIDGPDYGTCLKHLFETWSPEPDKERKAIGPKNLGIEGSPTGRLNYPSPPAIGY